MPTLAEVFRRCGAPYLQRYGDALLPSHRRAMHDIRACRTPDLGGHREHCPACGYEHYSFHSCNNRSCPTCCRAATERWLQRQLEQLLAVPYFHLVFTLPHELHTAVRSNQKSLYGLLMRCAAGSLQKLAHDPRYVGGTIGALCVLHTWTRAMAYHPHVHCLVPAGGLDNEGVWHQARRNFLVPVRALSILFRARFLCSLKKDFPDLPLAQKLWAKPWVVYCKPVLQKPEKVVGYLSRYIHRVAITNNRIQSLAGDRVTFRYKDSRDALEKSMTLDSGEFIRRFLQHVPPPRFHKVRSFGLLAPGNRRLLGRIRLFIAPPETAAGAAVTRPADDIAVVSRAYICPQCGSAELMLLIIPPVHQRAPP
jgi:hypothetical protein